MFVDNENGKATIFINKYQIPEYYVKISE